MSSIKNATKPGSVLLASLLSTIVSADYDRQQASMAEQFAEMPADLLKSMLLELLHQDVDAEDEPDLLEQGEFPHLMPQVNGIDENALDGDKKSKKKKKRKAKKSDELTPAEKQKEENAKHFDQLQEDAEDYTLQMPVKPERQEFKPSIPEGEGEDADDKHNFDMGETVEDPDFLEDGPKAKENTLLDDEPAADENDLNPFEEALKDNQNQKKRFIDELKREAEERKQRIKEEKEAKEKADQEYKEWLEKVFADTGELPPELAEIYAEDEKKRAEEEAKKRPEPPSAKTMRERVAEESKRRKDARMAQMRRKDEEDRAAKLKKRQEETERRRKIDPNYKAPAPLSVPKGTPLPPPDYKYPEKARKHGWGGNPEEEKRLEEQKLKEEEEREMKEIEELAEKKLKEYNEKLDKEKKAKKALRELDLEEEQQDELERHGGPQPETKRKPQKKHTDDTKQPHPETKRTPAKKDKKRRRRKPSASKPEQREAQPQPKKKPKPEHSHPMIPEPHVNSEEMEELEDNKPVHKQKEPNKQKQPEPSHQPTPKKTRKEQAPEQRPVKKPRAPKKAPSPVPSFDGDDWSSEEDADYLLQPQAPLKKERHREPRHLEPVKPVNKETRDHKKHKQEEPVHRHVKPQHQAEPHKETRERESLREEPHRVQPAHRQEQQPQIKEPHAKRSQEPYPQRHETHPLKQEPHPQKPYSQRQDQLPQRQEEPQHHHLLPILKEPDHSRYQKRPQKSEQQPQPLLPKHFEPIEHRYLMPVAPTPVPAPEQAPVVLDVPQFGHIQGDPMPMADDHDLEHDDWLSWPKYDDQTYYSEPQYTYPQPQPTQDLSHLYDQKFLELDKKTGHEHGRLSESENISSDEQAYADQVQQPRRRRHQYQRHQQQHEERHEDQQHQRQQYKRIPLDLKKPASDGDQYPARRQKRQYQPAQQPEQQSQPSRQHDAPQQHHKQKHEKRRPREDEHYQPPQRKRQQQHEQYQVPDEKRHAVLPWPSPPEHYSKPYAPSVPSATEGDSSMDEFYKDQGYKRRKKSDRKMRRDVPKSKRHITDKWEDVVHHELDQDYFDEEQWDQRHDRHQDQYRELSLDRQEYRGRRERSEDYSYHVEPVNPDLELFKQSYEYQEVPEEQQRGRHNQKEYYARSEEDRRYGGDRGETRPRHERQESYYSDDIYEEEDWYHEPRPTRQSRKPATKKDKKRNKKQMHPRLVPVDKDGHELVPKQPAQQFVIPSQPETGRRDEADESDMGSASSLEELNRRHSEPVVPVMRRRGEPLMVMPNWKNKKNPHAHVPSRYENHPTPQNLLGLKEQDVYSMSSGEIFEAEAHRMALLRNQILNAQDDLAQASLMSYFEAQIPHDHKQNGIGLNLEAQADNRAAHLRKKQWQPLHKPHRRPRFVESTDSEEESDFYDESSDEKQWGSPDSDEDYYDSEEAEYDGDYYDDEEDSDDYYIIHKKSKKHKPERLQDDIPDTKMEDLQEQLDNQEIIDQFQKAIDLLRSRSHRSNNGGLAMEFAEIKDRLRKGEHLDELSIEHDWRPNFIEPQQSQKSAQTQQEEKLSLRDLLADEEQLIADYEQKVKAREERRRAAAAQQQQEEQVEVVADEAMNFLGHHEQPHVPAVAQEQQMLDKPVTFEIGSLHDHRTGDLQEMMPEEAVDFDKDPLLQFDFLHADTTAQRQAKLRFRRSRQHEIDQFEEQVRRISGQSDYGSDFSEGSDDELYALDNVQDESNYFYPTDYYGDQEKQGQQWYYMPHHMYLEYNLPSSMHLADRWNDHIQFDVVANSLPPNFVDGNGGKKKKKKTSDKSKEKEKGGKPAKQPAPSTKKKKKLAPADHSQKMQDQMDFLSHQRMLKDASMRRKHEKQNPKGLPVPPHGHKPTVPSKDKLDPATKKQPLHDDEQKPFDMMGYMKRQLLAKEKQMLAKELTDPTYKPLSPTAKKPKAVPKKDLDKLHEAEEKKRSRDQRDGGLPTDDKGRKDRALFDRLSKEKRLREQKLREANPDYEPLSPTAKPGKKKKKPGPQGPPGDGDGKQRATDTIFEEMQKRRLAHQQKLLDEDAKHAADDPSYTPKYKSIPASPDAPADPKDELQRRLDAARRKHLIDKEEQFEDLYSEEEEEEEESDDYGLQDYGYDKEESESPQEDDYAANLDYYYDAQGFAHPRKTKGRFGRERGQPTPPPRPQRRGKNRKLYRRNQQDESYSSSDASSYSVSSASDEDSFDEEEDESSSYDDRRYRPLKRHQRNFDEEDDDYNDQYSSGSSYESSQDRRQYRRPLRPVKPQAKPTRHTRPARPAKPQQRHPARRYRNDLIEAPQGPALAFLNAAQDGQVALGESDDPHHKVKYELHTRFEADMPLPALDINPDLVKGPSSDHMLF